MRLCVCLFFYFSCKFLTLIRFNDSKTVLSGCCLNMLFCHCYCLVLSIALIVVLHRLEGQYMKYVNSSFSKLRNDRNNEVFCQVGWQVARFYTTENK